MTAPSHLRLIQGDLSQRPIALEIASIERELRRQHVQSAALWLRAEGIERQAASRPQLQLVASNG